MKLIGKRVRSISLKNHGIGFAYRRSSIPAITGACLLKAGNQYPGFRTSAADE
jgi:hypothetical protein